MTTALYRRYRPESFAEVIGQEQVTGPLSIALTKNRINHAYLFSGPRGCGKTTSARILARCLNCADGPTPTPCGVCPSCVELARGGPGSLDVVEIDAASHGGVDDARDLRERAAFAPVRDRYKVFIIDEAHMVSPQGFNALLKIVEEPPEHIRFIFATTEPEKVIGTIRSRTHHYPFRLVPPERLTSYLAELCEREGVPAGKGVLPLVVRSGGGSVRDSLSVLDQLIGGAGEDGLNYATAVALLGYTDSALLDDVADALAAGDGATVFRMIDRVIESGHDPRRFVEDLLERFRDLLVVAALRDGGHSVFRGLPDDQLERMRSQATRFGASELSRAADVTNAALTEMTGATSPRLQLELLCARLLLPSAAEGERGIAARLDRLEKRINAAGGLSAAGPSAAGPVSQTQPARPHAAQPQPHVAQPHVAQAQVAQAQSAQPEANRPLGQTGQAWPEPSRPEQNDQARDAVPAGAPGAADRPSRPAAPASGPAPSAPMEPQPSGAGTGSGDLEAVRRMWTEVLNALASIKRTTWSLVSQYAQVLDYDGKRLLLGFDSAGRAQSFGRGAHPAFLRQALIDVIGLDCVVEAVASSEYRAGPPPSAGPARTPPPSPPSRPAPRDSAPRESSSVPAPSAPGPRAAQPAQSTPQARSIPPSTAQNQSTPQAPQNQSTPRTQPTPQAPSTSQTQPAPRTQSAPRTQPSRTAPAAWPTPQRQVPPSPPAPGPSPRTPTGRRPSGPDIPSSPYDDIPPPLEEPVWDDEAPPDDGWSSRRGVPSFPPPATTPPAPTATTFGRPSTPPVASPAAASHPSSQHNPGPHSFGRPTPGLPTPGPHTPGPQASGPPTAGPHTPGSPLGATTPPARPAEFADAEPATGGPDFDRPLIVGAQVIEEVLGGLVIEENNS